MTLWVLSGLAVMVCGFVLRFNPLVVILAAALASGLSAGLHLVEIIAAFGKAFNNTRYVTVIWIVLPVIGLLERRGLQERARSLIQRLKGATTGRLLIGYLLFRQVTAALGLMSIAGHAQTVRPLVAPMAVAAADNPDAEEQDRIKAMTAATDNVGVFFGEDIFIAMGSILLMKGFLEQQGIAIAPFDLSVWAIPTAFFAFFIHAFRLWRMDRKGAGQ